MLQRIVGPECPRCGSEDSEVTGKVRVIRTDRITKEKTTREQERRQCNFCNQLFQNEVTLQPIPPPVVYHVVRCPICKSDRTRVTSTRPRIRYHHCDHCGQNFKSVPAPQS
jgi:transcriptional regulator NrdR family protein